MAQKQSSKSVSWKLSTAKCQLSARAPQIDAARWLVAADSQAGRVEFGGRQMRCLILLFVFCLNPNIAAAATDHFVCVVQHDAQLGDDGRFKVRQTQNESFMVGQRFIVDRETGIVRGNAISNSGGKIVILDRGSAQNSFHAYWTHTPLVSAPFAYLHIMAFKQPRSPFVLIQDFSTYSGLCE